MLGQICQFFAVDSSNFPKNEHIIIGDCSKEGGFLIHYFLNLCQSQNRPLCFVSFSQSFNHYNTIAQKLGTNLLSARDENKNLVFIEAFKILEECILPSGLEDGSQNNYEPFEKLLSGDILPFVSLIKENVINLTKFNHLSNPVVIIDDLSFILHLGIKPSKVSIIISQLHKFLLSEEINGSLISYIHLDEHDEEALQVWSFGSHLSSMRIKVSDLKTGYCKEVHGQMEMMHRSINEPRQVITKKSQFKLSEKSVDIFASGLSAAVL